MNAVINVSSFKDKINRKPQRVSLKIYCFNILRRDYSEDDYFKCMVGGF